MSGNQLSKLAWGEVTGRGCGGTAPLPRDRLGRRDFLAAIAGAGAGAILLGCAGADATPPQPTMGAVRGEVVDLMGLAQPSLGRVYLMYESGLQTGRSAAVDTNGRFSFSDVAPGPWQVRFYAPGVAYVPEQLANPVRIEVAAGETVSVHFTIEHGWEDGAPMAEIYIGDYFFQEQPLGAPNAVTVVKVGTPICWYNVGLTEHTTTGESWDSGSIGGTGSYIWTPDRPGVFPYHCRFHATQMIASLRVDA